MYRKVPFRGPDYGYITLPSPTCQHVCQHDSPSFLHQNLLTYIFQLKLAYLALTIALIAGKFRRPTSGLLSDSPIERAAIRPTLSQQLPTPVPTDIVCHC